MVKAKRSALLSLLEALGYKGAAKFKDSKIQATIQGLGEREDLDEAAEDLDEAQQSLLEDLLSAIEDGKPVEIVEGKSKVKHEEEEEESEEEETEEEEEETEEEEEESEEEEEASKKKGGKVVVAKASKNSKPVKKISGKTSPDKKKAAPSKEPVEKDRFGMRLGTRAARINAVLTSTPMTIKEIQKKAKYNKSIHGHMNKLKDLGFVKLTDDGWKVAKPPSK